MWRFLVTEDDPARPFRLARGFALQKHLDPGGEEGDLAVLAGDGFRKVVERAQGVGQTLFQLVDSVCHGLRSLVGSGLSICTEKKLQGALLAPHRSKG